MLFFSKSLFHVPPPTSTVLSPETHQGYAALRRGQPSERAARLCVIGPKETTFASGAATAKGIAVLGMPTRISPRCLQSAQIAHRHHLLGQPNSLTVLPLVRTKQDPTSRATAQQRYPPDTSDTTLRHAQQTSYYPSDPLIRSPSPANWSSPPPRVLLMDPTFGLSIPERRLFSHPLLCR